MRELLVLVVPWALSTILLFRLLEWDERRLSPTAQARAFPDATRLSAVVMFGIFALPVHVARTRRGAWRVLGPPLALVGAGLGLSLVGYLVETIVEFF